MNIRLTQSSMHCMFTSVVYSSISDLKVGKYHNFGVNILLHSIGTMSNHFT